MITVEDLLQAYAYAYDAWLDPETERKNPIPEYAEFIRRSVSWENAKLRELVRKYVEYTSQDRCEGCVCKRKCNDGDVDECWQRTEIRELSRELGIEVDE